MEINGLQAPVAGLERARGIRPFGIWLFDLLLLVLSFFAVHVLKYGTLVVEERHDGFLIMVLLCWLILYLLLHRFSSLHQEGLLEGIGEIAVNTFLMAGLISLIIVMFRGTSMSRLLVYGTLFLYAGLEMAALGVYNKVLGKKDVGTEKAAGLKKLRPLNISVSLTLVDACLLFAAFFVTTYWKRGGFAWTDRNIDIFFMLYGAWLFGSILLRKFDKDNFRSIYNLIGLTLKSQLFLAAVLAFAVYGFRYHYLSRIQIFGSVVLFGGFELGLFWLYYRYKGYSKGLNDPVSLAGARPETRRRRLACPAEADSRCVDPVDEKIRHALHFFEPDLYGFIRGAVDLTAIDSSQSALMSSDTLFNVNVLEEEGHRLIINLHKINDIRFLNPYFLMAHAKLKPGGYLVGKVHTLETHRDFFFRQFSRKALAHFLYVFDFTWSRVFPKLPVFKKIYFGLTRGRNRLVSRAEILGRLFYCGFRPVAERVISDRLYFIARKDMAPAADPKPTYGPLVGLNRRGINGKPITVYKFRTMHPYSEYLQDYVYEQNHLEKGGKFKDDFRVTAWGALMRKFWIDELPMLYNWLRGDLQLVGVRPLSRQYRELYSPAHRKFRRLVKPGLLPPFYADMPTTLEEIMESERRYIEAYLKNPAATQVQYFFRCLYNILIKKRRSR